MFRLTEFTLSFRWSRPAACAAVLGLLMATAGPALAGIPWHADLPTARAAASLSQKPVLAIFTASWSPEAVRFAERTLASPEVAALVAACYEPVLVDVDAHPAVTKRMQIVRVPAACVLSAKGGRLATFDCPETPAEFVATAARAAQSAVAGSAGNPADASGGNVADPAAATTGLADGSGVEAVAPPVGGAISVITTKVRQLSDFTGAGDLPPQAQAGQQPLPTTPLADSPASRYASATATDTPVLPTAPSAWPVERPAAQASSFTNAPPQPQAAVRPSLEPAAAPPATPWLSPPSAVPPPPVAPNASATASDLPVKPAPTSSWSSFVAALQKPFSIFSPPPTKSPEPPKMPPARPESPLAMATAAFMPPPVAQQEAPPADSHGSMPLGLEGYCPVTLAERGVWTEGRAQWGVRHRGRTYLFAGPEQQQTFLANPDRFSPALSGDDPVLAVEQGKSMPGRRAYGVTYQSRIYLFTSPETRAAFTAAPERFTTSVVLAERPARAEATRRY